MEALAFFAALVALCFGGRYITRKLRVLKLTPQPDDYEMTKRALVECEKMIALEKRTASLLRKTLKILEKDRASV